MTPRKIAIIGISGSGKSTISRVIVEKMGLPLFHMDQLFWKGKWEAIPEADYLREHENLVQKDTWIIEGWLDKKMASRLRAADLILYLDYSGLRCAWQVILRWLKHRKESRPELPKEALEHFSPSRVWLALTRGERKDIEETIALSQPANLKRFRSPMQLKEYLENSAKLLVL